MANKQYGLILPKKNQLSTPRTGNIFDNSDESEEEEGTDWVKKSLRAENEKNKMKKQTQINLLRALKEDPTIFQYDEVYDEIERGKEDEKIVKKVQKKAKYIENLLKTADLRKKEQELRKDRMIQKEIEAEDAMFPDKERYVTSSYKAKLEEMKKFEELQQHQDRLEAIGDVTKQRDISGFYRHLYRQTIDKNDADLGIISKAQGSSEQTNDNIEIQSDINNVGKDSPVQLNVESQQSSRSDDENTKGVLKNCIGKMKQKRQYRKRAQEVLESESDEELEKDSVEKDKLEENKVEDNKSEMVVKKQKVDDNLENGISDENNKNLKDDTSKSKNNDSDKNLKESTVKNDIAEIKEEKPKMEEKKKINIWLKRTVGEVFDAALQRYLIRKQERLAGS